VRGASALQSVLDQVHGQRLRVFIVWEPVIWTDMGPPGGSVLSRISDSRTAHFWDQDLLLSKKLVQEQNRSGVRVEAKGGSDPDAIIWDFVAVFPPGARWDETFPQSVYHGSPLLEHVEQVLAKLVELMGEGNEAGAKRRPTQGCDRAPAARAGSVFGIASRPVAGGGTVASIHLRIRLASPWRVYVPQELRSTTTI